MRKGELFINYTVTLGPLLLGLAFALALGFASAAPGTVVYLMAVCFLAGFALFAVAKASVIKQGSLVSFGSSRMQNEFRFAYYLGYGLMGFGLVLLVGFVVSQGSVA